MLGIPVLQAYGLTETTAICTLDDPRVPIEPGYVGTAVSGIEMKIGDNEEIVVRGPNIFPGYWNRPEETARVLQDGWFHTGDQGEVNVYFLVVGAAFCAAPEALSGLSWEGRAWDPGSGFRAMPLRH